VGITKVFAPDASVQVTRVGTTKITVSVDVANYYNYPEGVVVYLNGPYDLPVACEAAAPAQQTLTLKRSSVQGSTARVSFAVTVTCAPMAPRGTASLLWLASVYRTGTGSEGHMGNNFDSTDSKLTVH
jgi:hypothetical protein